MAMNGQRTGRRLKSAIGSVSVAELRAQLAHLLVRQAQELLRHAELMQQLERRGMDGVAAEVAQEVAVLLEHHDLEAGAREEQAEHHARPGRRRRCSTAW